MSIPRRYYVYGALGGAGLVAILMRRRPAGLPSFATGDRATRADPDAQGFVRQRPKDLAAQAGADVESYTLARFAESEFSSGSPVEKTAVMWAIVNESRRRGWSLLRIATTVCWRTPSRGCEDTGMYGRQSMTKWRPTANRYAATSRDPTKADIYLATQTLHGSARDPTGGATKFLDPSAFGKQSGTRSLEEVLAKWKSEGNVEVAVAGVRREKLMLFRQGGAVSGISGITRQLGEEIPSQSWRKPVGGALVGVGASMAANLLTPRRGRVAAGALAAVLVGVGLKALAP